MYHYNESGLSNVFLKNGYTLECIDDEEYTSIDDLNGLHQALSLSIIERHTPLTHEEFRFLRLELNLSQKILATRFGVSEQTIARYEKNSSAIPRTTDAALRSLYMEKIQKNNPVSYFLDLLSDHEASTAGDVIKMEEVNTHWAMTL